MNSQKKICAVIVTYNRLEVLKSSLAHVMAQTLKPSSIIVVDNNSTDGTVDYLKSIQGKDNIETVYTGANIGYAGGIAHGMARGLQLDEFDYFWIMDDDSLPQSNTLNDLVETIKTTSFDILGLEGSNYRYGVKQKIPFTAEKVQAVDFVLIDGALVTAAAVKKVGFPNEKFFMMCEDYEYCKRLSKNGFKVGLLNMDLTKRLHLGGGGKFTKATLWRGYYHSRNHLLIIREYFSVMGLAGYLFSQAKFIMAAALHAPDRSQRVKFRLKGMWHGLTGVKGKTLDPGTLKFSRKP